MMLFREQCTEFFSVQCCLESLHRVFTCAMLSGASWTPLHRVFTCTCAIMSQENYDNREKDIKDNVIKDNIIWHFSFAILSKEH